MTRVVHTEVYDIIEAAIMREKHLEAWRRSWKLNLSERHNPNWQDLYPKHQLDRPIVKTRVR